MPGYRQHMCLRDSLIGECCLEDLDHGKQQADKTMGCSCRDSCRTQMRDASSNLEAVKGLPVGPSRVQKKIADEFSDPNGRSIVVVTYFVIPLNV